MHISKLSVALAFAGATAAHEPTLEQREVMIKARPFLDHCQTHFNEQESIEKTAKRNLDNIEQARVHYGLQDVPLVHPHSKRQSPIQHSPAEVLRTNHRVYREWNDVSMVEMFGESGICHLTPEDDIGPLYVGKQHIRSDLRDGQQGVPLHLEIQVIDVKTCQPVEDAYVDFWAANATGVYSAILNFPGNGDPKDRTLIKKHHGRGIQPTDVDGIAHFLINVPGHYVGRATHMHIGIHHNVKQANNGTAIKGGHVSHIGQLYMDQMLLQAVESVYPYNTNKSPWTMNSDDAHFLYAATGGDPVLRYALLGSSVANGMYAWIRVAVDLDARRPMPGYKAKRSEPTAQPEAAAPSEPTKKPFALPLALALPKMYLYGSSFMPQDLNAQESQDGGQKNDKKRDKHLDQWQDKKEEIQKENHLEVESEPESK